MLHALCMCMMFSSSFGLYVLDVDVYLCHFLVLTFTEQDGFFFVLVLWFLMWASPARRNCILHVQLGTLCIYSFCFIAVTLIDSAYWTVPISVSANNLMKDRLIKLCVYIWRYLQHVMAAGIDLFSLAHPASCAVLHSHKAQRDKTL